MSVITREDFNSLPEQVQENKDNIKALDDSLEATKNDLTPRVEALETEMAGIGQYVEYQEDGTEIDIKAEGDIRVIVKSDIVGIGKADDGNIVGVNTQMGASMISAQNDINIGTADETTFLHIEPNRAVIQADETNIYAGSNATLQLNADTETAIIGANNGVSLITDDNTNELKFDDNGDIILTKANNSGYFFKCKDSNDVDVEFQFNPNSKQVLIDGVAVGGSALYEHFIVIEISNVSNIYAKLVCHFIDKTSTQYNTKAKFLQGLLDLALGGSSNKLISTTGYFYKSNTNEFFHVLGMYYDAGDLTALGINDLGHNSTNLTVPSFSLITDTIKTL